MAFWMHPQALLFDAGFARHLRLDDSAKLGDIRCEFDRYPAQAAQSRKAVLGRCIAENAILIPVHFVAPVACRVGGRAEAPVYRPLVPSEPKGFADV